MDVSAIVFIVIWVALLALGAAKSVQKSKKQDPSAKPYADRPQAQKPAGGHTRAASAQGGRPVQARPVAAKGSIENMPHEDLAEKNVTTAAPEAPKSLNLDFDPEEMVIYADIMKPGYEKY